MSVSDNIPFSCTRKSFRALFFIICQPREKRFWNGKLFCFQTDPLEEFAKAKREEKEIIGPKLETAQPIRFNAASVVEPVVFNPDRRRSLWKKD
jgi:hypothetical protein